MSWFFYLAYKQLFPTKTPLSIFTCFQVIGVALGVAVLWIILSVMNGFGEAFHEKIVGTQGHLQVLSKTFIENKDELAQQLHQNRNIQKASPFVEGVACLQFENKPIFPQFKGVAWSELPQVLPSFLIYTQADTFESFPKNAIAISSTLARRLGIQLGNKVQVISPLALFSAKSKKNISQEATLRCIFDTGWNTFDDHTVLCSLAFMQKLYGLTEQQVHGFMIRLTEECHLWENLHALKAQFPELRIESWQSLNADLLYLLRFEKASIGFVILFILLIASFSMMIASLLLVLKKTKEIGLLKALGASSREIFLLFFSQGLVIGISGLFSGFTLGFTLLHFRNDIVGWLSRITKGESAFLEFYAFAKIPAECYWQDAIFVIVFTLAISLLATLLPALRAAKLPPANALRNE